jgi:hypothetical protein
MSLSLPSKKRLPRKPPAPMGSLVSFKKCWHTVKFDLLLALNQMSSLSGQNWNLLNTAHTALIPKKTNALRAAEFRPVSLTHSKAKILEKLLALRLAPELCDIISPRQSAFLKKRSIQGNFLDVQLFKG